MRAEASASRWILTEGTVSVSMQAGSLRRSPHNRLADFGLPCLWGSTPTETLPGGLVSPPSSPSRLMRLVSGRTHRSRLLQAHSAKAEQERDYARDGAG